MERGGQIDRPFDPHILEEASRRAPLFRLALFEDDKGFYARVPEFPGLVARGISAAECEAKARRGILAAIALLLEQGADVPVPVSARRVQVNVRLTLEERALLEDARIRQGCESLSEFVRDAALARARFSDAAFETTRETTAGTESKVRELGKLPAGPHAAAVNGQRQKAEEKLEELPMPHKPRESTKAKHERKD